MWACGILLSRESWSARLSGVDCALYFVGECWVARHAVCEVIFQFSLGLTMVASLVLLGEGSGLLRYAVYSVYWLCRGTTGVW